MNLGTILIAVAAAGAVVFAVGWIGVVAFALTTAAGFIGCLIDR